MFVTVSLTASQSLLCVNLLLSMPGARGFKRVRAGVVRKIFDAWKEIDPEQGEGIEEKDPTAKIPRDIEVDGNELNTVAEGLLGLAADPAKSTGNYVQCQKVAEWFSIGPWFSDETKEAIPTFKGKVEGKKTAAESVEATEKAS